MGVLYKPNPFILMFKLKKVIC